MERQLLPSKYEHKATQNDDVIYPPAIDLRWITAGFLGDS